MAVMENSAAENSQREEEENDSGNSPLSSRTRTKDSGIRVRNGRIYDFENVKTCHRCRQKTRDFAAFCKKPKNKKPSPLTFCHICLFNKKKKGYEPTGMLAHTAKNLLFLTRVGPAASKRSCNKENQCDEQNDAEPNEEGSAKK